MNNAGGAITANGGSVQAISSTIIQGGTLNVLGGGTMETGRATLQPWTGPRMAR